MSERIPHNNRWVIVTVNKPVLMRRSDDETWLLNPKRRYILNADLMTDLEGHINSMSDLQSSSLYRPLHSAPRVRLPGSSLLIERYRDRGLGDLLFLTGPLAYLHHVTGGDIKPHLYAYAERGAVLNNSPLLAHNNPLVGPILYDDLPHYNFHLFLDTVTEYSEEPDQYNVYDSLFQTIGIDPATVAAKFKRPYAEMVPAELKQLDDFFFWVFQNTKPGIDLRKTGYYVIAPFSNSSLRTARYNTWLEIIDNLAAKRPVLVVGAVRERMPSSDITPGEFVNNLDSMANQSKTGRIINLIGKTQVRNLMQLILKANCVGSMDSAALYIAQAFRTPCVSLWGSHDPGVRIGYDPDYMKLAVWHRKVCAHSPCYAWHGFPADKCPSGARQTACACIEYVSTMDIMNLFHAVEDAAPSLVKPATAPILVAATP